MAGGNGRDRFATQFFRANLSPSGRYVLSLKGTIASRIRPHESGFGNLYLAGDYTQTGWPATMEGAVRSGYLAAGAVASHLLPGKHRFLVKDLPVQWPARLMGL